MRSFDVVIVGAGVIGASVAYHLAKNGCRNVLVIEQKSAPGEGSTLKATGGFRCQFGSEINVRLSLLSREKLRSFEAELGIDSGYRTYGYLFVAMENATLKALQDAQAVQKSAGLTEVEQVDPDAIARINPSVRNDQLFGGVYCPTDGFIRAGQILKGYVEKSTKFGVNFEFGVRVRGFGQRKSSRIETVQTNAEEIRAGAVVNAAGAWAAQVSALAGQTLPVAPLRRQVAITYPSDVLPEDMPMTIYADDGYHVRVRDGRILLLWPDQPSDPDPFSAVVTESWLQEVLKKTRSRIPALRDVQIDRQNCWAGLYEMSPDKHAIIGRAPGSENFYLINGSSGHGVMHAPALGQLLSEMILNGHATTLDLHPLRPSRFEEGQPIVAAQFL